jgi:hypothetical protein
VSNIEWIIDPSGLHIARKDGVEFAALTMDNNGRYLIMDITDPDNIRRVTDRPFNILANAKIAVESMHDCAACWRGFQDLDEEHTCKTGLELFKEHQAELLRARQKADSEIIVEPGQGTHYVVEFDGQGYYAKRQPAYDWSFTPNIEDANTYKTLKGARDRAIQGKALGKSVIVRIRPINVAVAVSVPTTT